MLKLLVKTNEIYPNDAKDFNIYDDKLRTELHISKPINPELHEQINIIGYLDDKLVKENKIYDYIRNFNNERYYKQLSFTYKLLELLKQPTDYINNLKVPTAEQLTNAILYCKKYDIPYIDKFSTPAFQDKFSKQILHEAYGLHVPIHYLFKTPFTLKLKSLSLHIKTKKNKKMKLPNKDKTKLSSFNFSTFFNDDSSSSRSLSKSSASRTRKNNYLSKSHSSKSLKQNYSNKVNLIPELDTINNRIEQTTKLIYIRRNFDAPNENMQNLNCF